MAEVNQDLVQQLQQNLASFEAAGLDEEAESVKAKLAEVEGSKKAATKTATAPTKAKEK